MRKAAIRLLAIIISISLLAAVPVSEVYAATSETILNTDTFQSIFSGKLESVYRLTPTVALKTSDGKYFVANTSSKGNFGAAPVVISKKKNGRKGEFHLLRCRDGNYALRSTVNRRYFTGESLNRLRFESDFVSSEEKLTLAPAGSKKWKLSFIKSGQWLCIRDSKLDTTDSKSEAATFSFVLCNRNDYSKTDLKTIKSSQWFGLSNGFGYWTIQEELGGGRTDAIKALGYTCFDYDDPKPEDGIVTIDNMQCVVGVREIGDKTDLLIAFQGTGGYDGGNSGDLLQDLTTNLDKDGTIQSGTSYGGTVNGNSFHVGYMRMADRLWDYRNDLTVTAGGKTYNLGTLLKSIIKGKTTVKLTVLGHSMGGAIAQCFAERICNECSSKSAKTTFLKNVRGRTFESALALSTDKPEYTDWINICVDTDTVPNGVVKGSILEKYGIHRLGRTIWLYDDDPETGITDTLFSKWGNIADYKHTLGNGVLPYKLITSIRTSVKQSIGGGAIASIGKQTYTGKTITPDVNVNLNGNELGRGFDYYVIYKNNKKIGTATVTAYGIGEYSGTIKKTFQIVPKNTKLSSVKAAGSTAINIKWKKQASNTKGYQLQYSSDGKFAGSKTKSVTIKNIKTTSYKIKGLKANVRYYVRIRTYTKVGKKTYYSLWSSSKSAVTPISYYLPVKCTAYEYGDGWHKTDTVKLTYNKHGDIVKAVNSEQTVTVALTYRSTGKLYKSKSTRKYKDGGYTDTPYKASYNSKGQCTSNSYYYTVTYNDDGLIEKQQSKDGSDFTVFEYLYDDTGAVSKVRMIFHDNTGVWERFDSLDPDGIHLGSDFEYNSSSWNDISSRCEYKRDSKGRVIQCTSYLDNEPVLRYKLEYPASTKTNAVTYDKFKYVRTVNTCCNNLTYGFELPYIDYIYSALF